MSRIRVAKRHLGLACALCAAIALSDAVRSKETRHARAGVSTHPAKATAGVFADTGADNCNDVSVIPLTAGPIGSPTTVLVTGDNTSATGPDCDNPTASVWWEAFQLDQSAIVTVSLCGTEPAQNPSYIFVFDACPTAGTDCGSKILRDTGGRGEPGCPDDNVWMVFDRLDPGIYYYPIRSDGVRGPYQMQISAEALPALTVGPDIVAGTIGRFDGVLQLGRAGSIGSGTVGLGVSTTMCNKGDQTIDIFGLPSTDHQLIVANAYRWSELNGADRLEQIGQSWVKHTFGSKNINSCLFGCDCSGGECGFNNLAPGCSDSYLAAQFTPCALGPRSAIHPFTGVMPGGEAFEDDGDCSFSTPASNHVGHDHLGHFSYAGIDHRLQIRDVDLIPTLNEGARYYTEGQYITPDEFISGNGNQHNNVAHREVGVSGPDGMGVFQFTLINETFSESPALDAWEDASRTVIEPAPLVDGRAILAYKVTALDGDVWHYEYAIYNMNMDRAIEPFSIQISADAEITNIGFHAPLNYTAQLNTETFSNDPWTVGLTGGEIRWQTDSFAVDPQANAIPLRHAVQFSF